MILVLSLCFFEQLCAIAVSQRTANLSAVFTLAGGEDAEFPLEKAYHKLRKLNTDL